MWYLYDVGKQTLKKWKFASTNLEINLTTDTQHVVFEPSVLLLSIFVTRVRKTDFSMIDFNVCLKDLYGNVYEPTNGRS